ncbi:DNA polymerase III subunit delta [Camelimonas abortus]|uniref:DNA-directed DNA polymerase n=1 Tax=Camelimonas abortus TaxID=1017184 RepID=A0ABV7LCE4_9HYPH
MVAVKPADIRSVLSREPREPVVLVFGPDQGLVAERAGKLASLVAGDGGDDPFRMLRIDGDALAQDPARLVDEANTISLFGGKRVIQVRAGSRNIAPAVKPLLDAPPKDAVVIIQAGDLARNAPLRTLCERSATALAIPCYADGPREIAALVDEVLGAHGLQIDADARAHLLGLLGADRQTSRNELEKLALYAHGCGAIDMAAVDAVCGDAAALAYDALTDAVFTGALSDVDTQSQRLVADGADPGVLLNMVVRHGLALLSARIQIESGAPAGAALERMRVHFKRRDAVQLQLRLWRAGELQQVLRDTAAAVGNCRKNASLSAGIARTAMWAIAMRAARRARQG